MKTDKEYFEEAKDLVIKEGYCSGSLLQQHFKIGYNKSGKIIDELEDAGVIGQFDGSKERKVLITKKMNNNDLIKLGFKEMPHFTVMNSVVYDLGRGKHLSAGCVGTPNEMVFICEVEEEITDCICLHNYDYDGYLTEEKIKLLIQALKK